MAQNIEIKAKLTDAQFEALFKKVSELVSQDRVLLQTDTFFAVPNQRLKLREFEDGTAELIAYSRDDQEGPKLSDYIRTPIADPNLLKTSLRRTIGISGVVRKRRDLFLYGQTRIHLDDVEGLGKFVELEVVLDEDQSHEDGTAIADQLTTLLEIQPESFISVAYIDLIQNSAVHSSE